jgi:hypothetical protein
VITKQNTIERASRLNDISTFRFPAFIHSQTLTEYDFTPGNELKKATAVINVRMATIPIDPAPVIPAILRLSLRPKRARIRKLKKGIAGIRGIIVSIQLVKLILIL